MVSHEHNMEGKRTSAPVKVSHMHVQPGRLTVSLVCDRRTKRTCRSLLEAVERDFPHIREHSCVNAYGKRFGAVADDTSIAHLFEHMVIERQAVTSRVDTHSFVGVTRTHVFDDTYFSVELSFYDLKEVCAAVCYVVDYLNAVL